MLRVMSFRYDTTRMLSVASPGSISEVMTFFAGKPSAMAFLTSFPTVA